MTIMSNKKGSVITDIIKDILMIVLVNLLFILADLSGWDFPNSGG